MILALAFVVWLCVVEYKIAGGRHTPALYFLLYMSAIMTICMLLSGEMPFSSAGFFFLAAVSGAFWLGHLCSELAFQRRPAQIHAEWDGENIERILALPLVLKCLRLIVIFGMIAGFVALSALWQGARSAGIEIDSMADLGKLPAFYSAFRYTPGAADVEPLAVHILMPVLEAGAAAGGLLRTLPAGWAQRLFQYGPLAIAFLLTLTTGARSYFFMNCTWFFASLIAMLCVRGTVFTQLRSIRFLAKAGVALSVAFLFGSAFSLLRFAANNLRPPTFDQFLDQLTPIMATSLQSIATATIVFDKMTIPGAPLHFAAYTFAPVMAWLGLEAYRYPPTVFLNNGLSDSNQYSLVGFLLLDFGPLLTALIFFVTGLLSAAAVRMIRSGVIALLPFLIAIICVILFSLIHNFFSFTTHALLFLAMTICGILLQWVTRRAVPA